MNTEKGRIALIAFKSLAQQCGLDSADKTAWGTAESKKIMTLVESRLNEWIRQPSRGSAARVVLDPEFEKIAPKSLHAVFDKHGNRMEIGMLTAFFMVESNTGSNIESTKRHLRQHLKAHSDVYSVGAGGAPVVVRLKNSKGKPTGETVIEKARKTPVNTAKGLLRFSNESKAAFDTLRLPEDKETFKMWVQWCTTNQRTSPNMDDLREWATVEGFLVDDEPPAGEPAAPRIVKNH